MIQLCLKDGTKYMKVIYMAPTMELLFKKNAESAQALVDSGVTKQTESGMLYLVIDIDTLKNRI